MNTTPDSGGRGETPSTPDVELRPPDSASPTTMTCPECQGVGSTLVTSNCGSGDVIAACLTCDGDGTITVFWFSLTSVLAVPQTHLWQIDGRQAVALCAPDSPIPLDQLGPPGVPCMSCITRLAELTPLGRTLAAADAPLHEVSEGSSSDPPARKGLSP